MAVQVLEPSLTQLRHHMAQNNLFSSHKLHLTVISTRSDVHVEHDQQIHHAQFAGYDVFQSRSGRAVLVAVLDAPTLVARHNFIVERTGVKHDFHDYRPHLTLCYNWTGEVQDLDIIDFPLLIGKEYSNPQDIIWDL